MSTLAVIVTGMVVLVAGLMFVPAKLNAQSVETGFLDRTLIYEGNESRYQVYVPCEYSSSRQWPVVLFLHGSGERGVDGVRPTQVGIGSSLRYYREGWPVIADFPQWGGHRCPGRGFERIHDRSFAHLSYRQFFGRKWSLAIGLRTSQTICCSGACLRFCS